MDMIKKTDVRISKSLFVARACVTNKARFMGARDTAFIVNKTLEKFRKYLDFPKDLTVRITSFKARYLSGRYWCDDNVVELDYNMPWCQVLEVLAHELVHAEQYHQKRLKKKWVRHKGWVHSWYGSMDYSKGSTHQSYMNQPWEKEAWERQSKIAEQVNDDMEKEYVQE